MHVIGIVGPSDSGKTSVIEGLLSHLSLSYRVATIKHLTHPADLDTDGKDTFRHRESGSIATFGISESDWFASGDELTLDDALEMLAPSVDVCLLEGFSTFSFPAVVLGEIDYNGPVIDHGSTHTNMDYEALTESIFATEPYVTLGSLIQKVKRSEHADRAGAIATFTGRVRAKDFADDDPTEFLEFDYYEGMAETRLESIKRELESRDGVLEVLMHHRTGKIERGKDIVFVVVLAGHRREAFDTVEDGINRLKAEVPIFKKEITIDSEYWVHERAG